MEKPNLGDFNDLAGESFGGIFGEGPVVPGVSVPDFVLLSFVEQAKESLAKIVDTLSKEKEGRTMEMESEYDQDFLKDIIPSVDEIKRKRQEFWDKNKEGVKQMTRELLVNVVKPEIEGWLAGDSCSFWLTIPVGCRDQVLYLLQKSLEDCGYSMVYRKNPRSEQSFRVMLSFKEDSK
jgi:hypothetical protein